MSNPEKLIQLIIDDGLSYLFRPVTIVNRNKATLALSLTMEELTLTIADFKELDDYCREIISVLDGHWSVLCEYGYGSYVYRHPDVHMKSLVGSMFFKRNIKGSRMAISNRAHRKLGELLNNTEMVLRLEGLTKHLDVYLGLQVSVRRHTSDEGYTTLNVTVESDDWGQTALFRCLFGPNHPYTV